MGVLSALKGLTELRESIGPRQYHGFQRVPWDAGIAEWSPDAAQSSGMAVAAFFKGVQALSQDIAALPWFVFRRLHPRGKERATDHPLYPVFHDAPNPQTTSFRWRELGVSDLIRWGNWYSEIVFDVAGRPQLYRIPPHRVKAYWNSRGERAYDLLKEDGSYRTMRPGSVFHVPGVLGDDGLTGLSILQQARRSLGIAVAADKHAAAFWTNGAMPRLFLTLPQGMPPKARENFRDAWNEAMSEGWVSRKGTAILEDGIKPEPLTMPMDDAQFLQTREFQVTDTARWLNLPPDRVGDFKHANNAALEASQITYVTHSLMPWLVRIDQEAKLQFFYGDPDHFTEFNVDGLLRGDTSSRVAYYNAGRSGGWLSINEVRDRENYNRVEQPEADDYLQPMNMQPIGAEPQGSPDRNPTPMSSDPQPPELLGGGSVPSAPAATPAAIWAVESLETRVNAATSLIRSGFEPTSALDAVGLPAITHTGMVPVTVKEPNDPEVPA